MTFFSASSHLWFIIIKPPLLIYLFPSFICDLSYFSLSCQCFLSLSFICDLSTFSMAGYLFLSFICVLSSFSLTLIYLPLVHLWYLFLLIDSDISYFPSSVLSSFSFISSLPSSVIYLTFHWQWYIFNAFICDLSSFSLTFIYLPFLHLWSPLHLIYLFPSFICDQSYFSLTVLSLLFLHLWSLLLLIDRDSSSFLLLWSLFLLIDSAISSFSSYVIRDISSYFSWSLTGLLPRSLHLCTKIFCFHYLLGISLLLLSFCLYCLLSVISMKRTGHSSYPPSF